MSTTTHDAPASLSTQVEPASQVIGGPHTPQPMAPLTHVEIVPDRHSV